MIPDTLLPAGKLPGSLDWTDPSLINTIGHGIGVLLFSVVIVLLRRDWRYRNARRTGLALIAASLALCWNIGSLVVLAAPESPVAPAVGLFSFVMLTILPAVLLQVAMQHRRPLMVAAGYGISIIACALHASQILIADDRPHQSGLLIVAISFPVLAATSLSLDYVREHRAHARSEWLSFISLLVFTSSFLHFGYRHSESPWAAEIAWHHIGIPVALIVLLRDYRFLLLDTFVRFAANFGLAAIYVAAAVGLGLHLKGSTSVSSFVVGISLVTACLALIGFAYGRSWIQAWLNRAIFRRQNVAAPAGAIAELGRLARTEEELLNGASEQIAQYLRATQCLISPDVVPERLHFHAEAQIPLRLSSGQVLQLAIGPRLGGRRYWSDDLDDVRHLSTAVVEQLERFRSEEMKRLVGQAELRALQAQINPHFLFNAFNTLYGVIDRGSHDARRMVLNLSELFRYFLQGQRTFIPLSEEMRIVRAYLEIETLRLGTRLQPSLLVSEEAGNTPIPILSIQPLVENAVKHGVESKSDSCQVTVAAALSREGLRITVTDSGAGFHAAGNKSRSGTGIGLDNVRRRLALSYGPGAELEIRSGSDGTSVSFLIPAPQVSAPRIEPSLTSQSS